MTTYYGVWSGSEWWYKGPEIFHTTTIGLARAQAMVANRQFEAGGWDERFEVRAIGEDGLPVKSITELFEVNRASHQCAMADCAMCGKPAKEWVDVRIKGWMCEQHSHVSVGCLSEKEEA